MTRRRAAGSGLPAKEEASFAAPAGVRTIFLSAGAFYSSRFLFRRRRKKSSLLALLAKTLFPHANALGGSSINALRLHP
jgi:hypothetical protein